MDSPIFFQVHANARAVQSLPRALGVRCPPSSPVPVVVPVPGPALLPPDGKGRSTEWGLCVCVTSLGRGGGGRDSGPSSAPAYAGGNPGQRRREPWAPAEPVQTYTDVPALGIWPRIHPLSLPSWESPRFCAEKQWVSINRDVHGQDMRQMPQVGGVLGKAMPGLPAAGAALSIGAGEVLPCEHLGFAGQPPHGHLQTLRPDQAELSQRHQDAASPHARKEHPTGTASPRSSAALGPIHGREAVIRQPCRP